LIQSRRAGAMIRLLLSARRIAIRGHAFSGEQRSKYGAAARRRVSG